MTRHLLKLIWNRKRTNGLIAVEIFFSFLIVFAVCAMGLYLLSNYRRPLGFDSRGLWNVDIDMKLVTDDLWTEEMTNRFASILREVERLPQVEVAAGVQYPPYSGENSNGFRTIGGREVELYFNEVTDDAARVMRLEMVRGRWFSPEDDAAAGWEPVVIDLDTARAVYGSRDPIGQIVDPADDLKMKVVGVVRDFRKGGEYSASNNYVFRRVRVGNSASRPPRRILVRLKPGVGADFERELVQRLRSTAPEWSFLIQSVSSMRVLALRVWLVPMAIGGLIGMFMILMVALGLTGVMWQNVTQRTREIGVRRAMGSSGEEIHRQILIEIALITSVGVALGVAIVLQLPLLGVLGFLGTKVFLSSILLAMAAIYFMAMLCGLYPSWLATRVQPAEALRHE